MVESVERDYARVVVEIAVVVILEAVAAATQTAERQTLAGQPHNVAAEALAPALSAFFTRS
jgi:hypothetical protein